MNDDEPTTNNTCFEDALDRIAAADNVNEQARIEIQQYWLKRIYNAVNNNNTEEAKRLKKLAQLLEIDLPT